MTALDTDTSFDVHQSVRTERTTLRIPSRVETVEPVAMLLKAKAQACGACDPQQANRLVMPLVEALTNAIVHGNLEISSDLKALPGNEFATTLAQRSADPEYASRWVEIKVDYDGKRCVWTITDQGNGFDFEKARERLNAPVPDYDDPNTELDPALFLASGRGLTMIDAFVDEVHWAKGGREIQLVVHTRNKPENRSEPRPGRMTPVRVVPLQPDGSIDWNQAEDAVSLDLSDHGINMLTPYICNAQRLMVEIIVDDEPIYMPAQVNHVEHLDNDLYQIGCRFQQGLLGANNADYGDEGSAGETPSTTIARIDTLLSALHDQALRDHPDREAVRVSYTRPIEVVYAEDSQVTTRVAVARNLSNTGIAFVAEFGLERGDEITLLLQSESGKEMRFKAQVMRAQQVAGEYFDIGARFIE